MAARCGSTADLVRFASPRDARDAGIGMVHQELSAVRDLSVAENVHLGTQPLNRFGLIDWRAMRRTAATHLHSLGIDVDPRTRMGDLPLGLQQLVELARVLYSGARIIILDEPTSALSPPEVARLFSLLRRLRTEGKSFVFISHFLDDVLAICDRITVFRNGEVTATETCAAVDKRWVIDRMIGAGHDELEESYLADISLHSRPGRENRSGSKRADARQQPTTTFRCRCAAARCSASTASSAPASSSSRARCSAACPPTPAASRSTAARCGSLPPRRPPRGHRLPARKAGA